MGKSVSRRRLADGRRLRSELTRQAIIDAYLGLLRETRLIPTATQIAQRAGCSVRSVFERFADLMTLSFAAADHALVQAGAEAEALTDIESWGRMRERHGLSVEAACDVWTTAIDRILPPTPAA